MLDWITKLLREMELRHLQRIDALEKLGDTKFAMLGTICDSQAERVVLALAAADKAISKSEAATEKRFEGVNEFRQALSDQSKTFISRVEFEALRETNAARIADLSSRLDKTDGKAAGLNTGWLYLIGALTIISALLAAFAAFWPHK